MGLVLDSGVLIAAERGAKPVSELLATLEHDHGETTAEQARKRRDNPSLRLRDRHPESAQPPHFGESGHAAKANANLLVPSNQGTL